MRSLPPQPEDPGLEIDHLPGSSDWVMVGAESMHYCLGSGLLEVHQSEQQVQRGDLLFIPRATRYRLTATNERLRIRNRALAQNLPVDRHAALVVRAVCQWANENKFILPLVGADKREVTKVFRSCQTATSILGRKSAF